MIKEGGKSPGGKSPGGLARMSWSDIFLKVLKDNDVRLVTYVPDNVLTPDA